MRDYDDQKENGEHEDTGKNESLDNNVTFSVKDDPNTE